METANVGVVIIIALDRAWSASELTLPKKGKNVSVANKVYLTFAVEKMNLKFCD